MAVDGTEEHAPGTTPSSGRVQDRLSAFVRHHVLGEPEPELWPVIVESTDCEGADDAQFWELFPPLEPGEPRR
jgi:hypothetical protein